MTAAESPAQTDDARQGPPTPEECSHPAPVRGVMAHEFAPYSGAIGPEGTRRTTMYYGPVLGGLPIAAWHCETCGLLRLDYPDGRKEERRLFPGPQPGLLAMPVVDVIAPAAGLGRQPRVSGISAPPQLVAEMVPEGPALALPRLEVPIPTPTEAADLLVVAGLAATALCLLILGVGAVYDWRTASWEGPLAVTTAAIFGGAVLLRIAVGAFSHYFPWPALEESPAVRLRGEPELDGVTKTVVAILVVLIVGLGLGGILAVYDWRTPGAMGPLVDILLVLFGIALVVAVAGGTLRALTRRR